MRASWFRFLVWFFLAFVVVSTGFFGTLYLLESRPSESGSNGVTEQPIVPPSAGVTGKEVILGPKLLGLYVLLIALGFAVAGWFAIRKTFAPIVSLNDQLDSVEPDNLQVQIRVETEDNEIRELQEHINGLLSRISLNFHQLQSYSAQVAHELRAPLTIIRLKIEEAADKIEPSLAEEIQTELLRLTMHVEQALLIARAEQGHLQPNRVSFDLADLLEDVAQDFRLLAKDQGRQIEVVAEKSVISADPKYMKQILYSLLTNSLRHGRGSIYAALQRQAGVTLLSIKNRVEEEDSGEALNLGLGRRIVAALTAIQQNMQVQRDRKDGWYEVTLSIFDVVKSEKKLL